MIEIIGFVFKLIFFMTEVIMRGERKWILAFFALAASDIICVYTVSYENTSWYTWLIIALVVNIIYGISSIIKLFMEREP